MYVTVFYFFFSFAYLAGFYFMSNDYSLYKAAVRFGKPFSLYTYFGYTAETFGCFFFALIRYLDLSDISVVFVLCPSATGCSIAFNTGFDFD